MRVALSSVPPCLPGEGRMRQAESVACLRTRKQTNRLRLLGFHEERPIIVIMYDIGWRSFSACRRGLRIWDAGCVQQYM